MRDQDIAPVWPSVAFHAVGTPLYNATYSAPPLHQALKTGNNPDERKVLDMLGMRDEAKRRRD